MARGLQKIQSQKKNQERQGNKKNGSDNKSTADAKLQYSCIVCRTQMPDPKTYKMHFESKHPKAELPAEIREL